MKKTLLLFFLSFTVYALSAQIIHKDFGDGWVIPMNANLEVDLNEDGTTDFYINSVSGELGFTAIFAVGCFTSPSETAYTSFGARELMRHEEGDLIQLNGANLYDYIDDNQGSAYSSTGGLAEGWVDNEDAIIGFAVIVDTIVHNGWLRVSVDITTNELTIKEWAYTQADQTDTGGILAGTLQSAESTAVNRLENIEDLLISPNPASDRVQLNFDYSGNDNLSVVIQNSVGKEIFRNTNIALGSNNLNVDSSNWASGIYFVSFQTKNGIRTEKLSIER